MKNSTLATRLMLAAIFLTVAAYFGFSIAAYFTDPFRTTTAYTYTSDNAVSVSGYVVRDEEVLSSGGELVYSSRNEGERVSAGGTVALIYQTAQALSDANTLRSLTEQLEQLRYAQSLASRNQATARLDDEITSALLAFRKSLAGSVTGSGESGEDLRTAVLKRSYARSGTGELDDSIASLLEQINALSASADSGTTQVTAPKAGLFSSLVDGYEEVLDLETIRTLTPSGYSVITPAAGVSGVGKMVYGSQWAYVTVMRSKDISRVEVGDTITLRFQKGLDRDMVMRVDYISADENGSRVVVFASEEYLSLTTLLRRQNAQVIFDSYTGIRVPRSSVRVEQVPVVDEEGNPELDSKGNQKTTGRTGVFCAWGRNARFKPVTVLWQEDEYILVAPDEEALAAYSTETLQEGRRLRAGDEVITAAAELYDGMVIR